MRREDKGVCSPRRGALGGREVSARLALAAGAVLVGLIASEATLRLCGFSYAIAPSGVEFGWPNPLVIASQYVSDPDLFWVTPDYQVKLERLSADRPDLVFMGDSCTEFGGYTKEFVEKARAEHHGWPVLAEQLGVGGHTSFQGLRQLERDVAHRRPRAVTFFYGWNDHWIGFGIEDDQIPRVTHSWLARMDRLRLGQLLVKSWMALSVGRRSTWPRRVPPEDFRRNLTEMARVADEQGIRAVFLTAPTSHEVGHEPRRLAERWLNDLSELVPLHQEYAAIVREVGAASGAAVCDLARAVESLPPAERSRLFMADGIHFTDYGNRKIAEILLRCFEADRRLREILIYQARSARRTLE